ncbi:hypothetical protein MMC07_005291 [Pseudocyphellaria aurata]|nr:hypothetical protein [Pseudocyphellaria aurata]
MDEIISFHHPRVNDDDIASSLESVFVGPILQSKKSRATTTLHLLGSNLVFRSRIRKIRIKFALSEFVINADFSGALLRLLPSDQFSDLYFLEVRAILVFLATLFILYVSSTLEIQSCKSYNFKNRYLRTFITIRPRIILETGVPELSVSASSMK